jgi:ABC-2 type transport system ATP-binding protein
LAQLDFGCKRPLMTINSLKPLEILNLSKSYDSVEAVKDVSLDIAAGEIFGLLGPNGAGKTSIISIIVSLERATSGRVLVFGNDVAKDPRAAKVQVGWVPQEVINHGFFTVEEILTYHAGFYGSYLTEERKKYLLNRLSLWDHRKKRVRELSGGMKRRLMIAKALVHSPRLLLLDEPTAGVDIELRTNLWEFVKELQKDGVTILLTTHYLEEAEELCDRVAFIDRGQIRRVGETSKIVRELTRKKIILKLKDGKVFDKHPFIESQVANTLTLNVPMQAELGQVLTDLNLSLETILDIQILEGTLEDAFRSVLKEKR